MLSVEERLQFFAVARQATLRVAAFSGVGALLVFFERVHAVGFLEAHDFRDAPEIVESFREEFLVCVEVHVGALLDEHI